MKTTTKYLKSVKSHVEAKSILKPGSNNAKLGWNVASRKWKGAKLFSLTLVERSTCPTTCHHWNDCYGNNMPFVHRFNHAEPGFLSALRHEVAGLCEKHKAGVVIRLHVLGDFYSVDYVQFWADMIVRHPNLKIFGYTANLPGTDIGNAIDTLNRAASDKCVIRFSRNADSHGGFLSAANESFSGEYFDCPEQNGRIDSCASCGACWQVPKTVRFVSH